MQIPLLKGGSMGLMGTVPLVLAAAQASKHIVDEGEDISNWEKIVERFLGRTLPSFLETVPSTSSELLGAVIVCPTCSNTTTVE